MQSSPFLGLLFHAIGGLAAASFYIAYKRVKNWNWETYWLTGGVFSWIVAPLVMSLLIVPQTFTVLKGVSVSTLAAVFGFGVVWGIGGLTFGLTMRYLGIALGYAIALGLCAAFGTIMPPLFSGELIGLLKTASGQVVLLGVLVCLIGIGFSGQAGIRKERELTDQVKRQSVSEFNFVKGISVAIVSGLASAAMAYGFAAGKPIAQIALANNVPALWQNLPVLIIILAGGFLSNCIWCLYLIVKNKRCAEFVLPDTPGRLNVLLVNYLLCLIGGVTWYMQFFFYSMGSVKMGKYDFSSWTIHMAAIIIFSTIWGISLKEWQGTSEKTRLWVIAGLLTLILSTVIIGIGNKLAVSN